MIKTLNIFTNKEDSLLEGKADFLLAASVTKTCEIDGITQAGISGKISLTPTLDAEYITNEKVFSMPELAETPTGVPTPALITRAVHNLTPFSNIEILNLGLDVMPKNTPIQNFGINPSNSIASGANIDAREIFKQVDRAHREFTEDQIDFIADVVRLYRGKNAEHSDNELLNEKFSESKYQDIKGLCKVATLEEVEKYGWSLNPGRYVGVKEKEKMSDDDFYERLVTLDKELTYLNEKSNNLENDIKINLKEIAKNGIK